MASYTSGVVAEIGSLIEYRPGVTEVESKTSWETMFCPVFWQEEYMNRIVNFWLAFNNIKKKYYQLAQIHKLSMKLGGGLRAG